MAGLCCRARACRACRYPLAWCGAVVHTVPGQTREPVKLKPTRRAARILIAGVLAFLSAVVVLLVTLYLHFKVYAVLNPGEALELDHNTALEDSVMLHLRIVLPLVAIGFGWMYWRCTGKWFGQPSIAPGYGRD